MLSLLLTLSGPPVAADDLGRLFFTAAERAALDTLREGQAAAAMAAQEPLAPATVEIPPPAPAAAPAAPLELDGLVRRAGQPPTVWINGVDAVQAGAAGVGLADDDIRADGARVRLPLADGAVVLKPGQRFDPADGRVTDAYERDRPE